MKPMGATLRRYRWLLLIAVAAFFGLRWWMGSGGLERLTALPSGRLVGIHNGIAYLFVSGGAEGGTPGQMERRGSMLPASALVGRHLSIRALPVTGGQAQEISQDPLGNDIIYDALVNEAGIFYVVDRAADPSAIAERLRAKSMTSVLRHCALSGGEPRELLSGLGGYNPRLGVPTRIAVAGDTLYWIQAFPDEAVWKKEANGKAKLYRIAPHAQLMATPVAGGASHRVAGGLSYRTDLLAGENGVHWVIPHSDLTSEKQRDLFSFHLADSQPKSVLRDYPSFSPPRAFNGRFYWIRRVYQSERDENRLIQSDLMSVREDGAELRVEYSLPVGQGALQSFTELTPYRGSLYILVSEGRRDSNQVLAQRYTLCRVQLAPSVTLKKLCALPQGAEPVMRFDDDYCYFAAVEGRENWFDWSREGLRNRQQRVLYRCPLSTPTSDLMVKNAR